MDDVLKHARSVHLSLLALMFLILAVTFVDRGIDATKAREDLASIRRMGTVQQGYWLVLRDHLHNDIIPRLAGTDDEPRSYLVAMPDARKYIVELPSRYAFFTTEPLADSLAAGGVSRNLEIPWPGSLSRFERLWNGLGYVKLYHPSDPLGSALVWRDDAVVEEASYTLVDSVPANVPHLRADTFRLVANRDVPERIRASREGNPVHAVSVQLDPSGDRRLDLLFAAASFDYNAREAFDTLWSPKPYAKAFPELARITALYSDLPYETIDMILESEETRRAGREVDIFGASVPDDLVARWGVLLILAVQMYMVLAIAGVKRELAALPEGGVPVRPPALWSGVAGDSLSRGFVFATIVVLPTAVTVLLGILELWELGSGWRIVFGVALIIHAALAVHVISELTRIRKLVRT